MKYLRSIEERYLPRLYIHCTTDPTTLLFPVDNTSTIVYIYISLSFSLYTVSPSICISRSYCCFFILHLLSLLVSGLLFLFVIRQKRREEDVLSLLASFPPLFFQSGLLAFTFQIGRREDEQHSEEER